METTTKRKKLINNYVHTINYAVRIQNDSSTATDNIFVGSLRFSSSSTSPIINGLSDHDAQYIVINNIAAGGNLIPLKKKKKECK